MLVDSKVREVIERLASSPTKELLDEAEANSDCVAMISKNPELNDRVHQSKFEKTAKLWFD